MTNTITATYYDVIPRRNNNIMMYHFFGIIIVLLATTVAAAFGMTTTTMTSSTPTATLELYYFGLYAKFGSLLALEHSGIPYEFVRCGKNWKDLKPTTSWKCLPILKNLPPGASSSFAGGNRKTDPDLGQEAAILHYIATMAPTRKMKGENLSEELISQQLYGEGEDVYQALAKIKNKLVSHEQALAFWDAAQQDNTSHNRQFGIYVFLELLEAFCQNCGQSGEGKFTSSGCTVGECKLWASLYVVCLIRPEILNPDQYPGLSAFYARFEKEPATQTILSGTKTGGKLGQYFVFPVEE